jgi:phosphatidylserine/phosphatidylglycerophosphate/cardiolipin synthase-like enzyme
MSWPVSSAGRDRAARWPPGTSSTPVPRRSCATRRWNSSGKYSCSTGFYIHGKVIEADYGTGHAKMFVGSENFSRTSLDDNRELGLIISDRAVLSVMASTFAADFRNGTHWA